MASFLDLAHFRSIEHALESVVVFQWKFIFSPDLGYCKPCFFFSFLKKAIDKTIINFVKWLLKMTILRIFRQNKN